jgi:hypothetical protein
MSRISGSTKNLILFLILPACATTQVAKLPAALPEVPAYVKVPHPGGFDLADLKAIFFHPLAPKGVLEGYSESCDADFKKLAEATPIRHERKTGAIELVKARPEEMHWCFYSKVLKLQENLQSDSTWTERQSKVLEAYEFLTPVANAYFDHFHDSRYLRWASQYYTKVSEWVFFKRVVPTPENTLLLTSGTRTTIEPWVAPATGQSEPSVFAKYGISLMPTVAGAKNPLEQVPRAPASVESEEEE